MPDDARVAAAEVVQPWWQHAGWYRALMLAERLTTRSSTPAAPPPAPWQREQAQRRLQAWKAQPPFPSGTVFADRLAADELTEPNLLDLLAEPPEALQAGYGLPEWLEALRQALEGAAP